MPAAKSYETVNEPAIRNSANEELQQRREMIKRHWDYYHGRTSIQLKDKKDWVKLGLPRQAVDRTVSFLAPDFPAIELDAGDTTAEEESLQQVWRDNGGAVLLSNMALTGAISGHVFLRVLPVPLDEQGTTGEVKIINMNPEYTITFWDEDDYQKALWYEVHWTSKGDKNQDIPHRQDYVLQDGSWGIYSYRKAAQTWERYEEITWNAEYPPMIAWQHLPVPNAYYGQHEFEHVYLSDVANYIASNLNRIIRFHAYPKTVGVGFGAKEIESTSVDGFMAINKPRSSADVFNVEMQSDLGSSMNMLEMVRGMYFNLSRVAILPTNLDAFRNMTNLGIRAAFMDMIAKNETLRRQYTRGILTASQVIMSILDIPVDTMPYLVWGEALPVDNREELAMVQSQIGLGLMSKRTAAGRMGLNYDLERERMVDEMAEQDIMQNGAMIGVSG